MSETSGRCRYGANGGADTHRSSWQPAHPCQVAGRYPCGKSLLTATWRGDATIDHASGQPGGELLHWRLGGLGWGKKGGARRGQMAARGMPQASQRLPEGASAGIALTAARAGA